MSEAEKTNAPMQPDAGATSQTPMPSSSVRLTGSEATRNLLTDEHKAFVKRLARAPFRRRNLQHTFNGLLVVVGFFQVLLLWRQNTQIAIQSDQMTKQSNFLESQTADFSQQTKLIEGQLKAMEVQTKLATDQLRQAEIAAIAAKDAAVATRRSNEISAETAKMQLIAYFIPTQRKHVLRFDQKTGECSVELAFKNAGVTPAFKVEASTELLITPIGDVPRMPEWTNFGTVGPGREVVVSIQERFNVEKRLLLFGGGNNIVITVRVQYRDAYDRDIRAKPPFPSEINFMYIKGPPVVGEPGLFELQLAPVGND